jgi:DNA polymerase III epsilon subunit-like protein
MERRRGANPPALARTAGRRGDVAGERDAVARRLGRHGCGRRRPIFVGFNAPFDWMFVADYLWRFVGRNPFGISALDLKSVYLGRCWGEVRRWSETSSDAIVKRYGITTPHTHAPLDDALEQAEICRALLGLT